MSQEIKFNEETLALVHKMIKRYPEGKHKSALLPILHIAQAEFGGWLSPETMDYVASVLNIKPIEVYEVASFYSMYNLKPGAPKVNICTNISCMLSGCNKITEHLKNKNMYQYTQ